jgi:hypothetical protein
VPSTLLTGDGNTEVVGGSVSVAHESCYPPVLKMRSRSQRAVSAIISSSSLMSSAPAV